MTHFGGMGGIPSTRPLNKDDAFEMALHRALGGPMDTDHDLCIEVWESLANVDWTHTNGDTASYSFRAAGDLIAAVLGRGDYLDWYCSGEPASLSEQVVEAMLAEGWTPDAAGE